MVKGKGAPAVSMEAFFIGLGALLVNTKYFSIHLNEGDKLDKEEYRLCALYHQNPSPKLGIVGG